MSNYNEPNTSLRVIRVTLLIYFGFHAVMSVTISALKRCSVRLFLPLVGGLMSYSRCFCLCAYSCVQHILFRLFFLLCTLCCQFLCMVHFCLPLRYFYACYILICILYRCNHGNDLSDNKVFLYDLHHW